MLLRTEINAQKCEIRERKLIFVEQSSSRCSNLQIQRLHLTLNTFICQTVFLQFLK